MAEIIKFPQIKRSKLIDALLDIRLTLSMKKLVSDYIKKSELKKILDEEKKSVEDLEVSTAIDDLFKEYFEVKVNDVYNNQSLSINQMEDIIDKNIYQDSGKEAGKALVKTDGYHKSSYENTNANPDSKAA